LFKTRSEDQSLYAAELGAEAVAARLRPGGRAAWAEQYLRGVMPVASGVSLSKSCAATGLPLFA
jgi:hypothetical protein